LTPRIMEPIASSEDGSTTDEEDLANRIRSPWVLAGEGPTLSSRVRSPWVVATEEDETLTSRIRSPWMVCEQPVPEPVQCFASSVMRLPACAGEEQVGEVAFVGPHITRLLLGGAQVDQRHLCLPPYSARGLLTTHPEEHAALLGSVTERRLFQDDGDDASESEYDSVCSEDCEPDTPRCKVKEDCGLYDGGNAVVQSSCCQLSDDDGASQIPVPSSDEDGEPEAEPAGVESPPSKLTSGLVSEYAEVLKVVPSIAELGFIAGGLDREALAVGDAEIASEAEQAKPMELPAPTALSDSKRAQAEKAACDGEQWTKIGKNGKKVQQDARDLRPFVAGLAPPLVSPSRLVSDYAVSDSLQLAPSMAELDFVAARVHHEPVMLSDSDGASWAHPALNVEVPPTRRFVAESAETEAVKALPSIEKLDVVTGSLDQESAALGDFERLAEAQPVPPSVESFPRLLAEFADAEDRATVTSIAELGFVSECLQREAVAANSSDNASQACSEPASLISLPELSDCGSACHEMSDGSSASVGSCDGDVNLHISAKSCSADEEEGTGEDTSSQQRVGSSADVGPSDGDVSLHVSAKSCFVDEEGKGVDISSQQRVGLSAGVGPSDGDVSLHVRAKSCSADEEAIGKDTSSQQRIDELFVYQVFDEEIASDVDEIPLHCESQLHFILEEDERPSTPPTPHASLEAYLPSMSDQKPRQCSADGDVAASARLIVREIFTPTRSSDVKTCSPEEGDNTLRSPSSPNWWETSNEFINVSAPNSPTPRTFMAQICTPKGSDVHVELASNPEDPQPGMLLQTPAAASPDDGQYSQSCASEVSDCSMWSDDMEDKDGLFSEPLEYIMLDYVDRLPVGLVDRIRGGVDTSEGLLRRLFTIMRKVRSECSRQPTKARQPMRRSMGNLPRAPRSETMQAQAQVPGTVLFAAETLTELRQSVESLESVLRKLNKIWRTSEARVAVMHPKADRMKRRKMFKCLEQISTETGQIDKLLNIHSDANDVALDDCRSGGPSGLVPLYIARCGLRDEWEEHIEFIRVEVDQARSSLTDLGTACPSVIDGSKPCQRAPSRYVRGVLRAGHLYT